MTKNPVSIDADKTIREAVAIMNEKSLGSLFVQKGDDVIGMLEEGDILRKVLAKDLNPYVAKVEAGMSIPFIINQEKTDNDASDMMQQQKVRHLAVSDGSTIVGIISMKDLIRPIYAGKSIWT